MWGLPWSTFLAFIALVLTVLAAFVWALISKKDDKNDSSEDEV